MPEDKLLNVDTIAGSITLDTEAKPMTVDTSSFNALADQHKITVIVPAYNEAGRIEKVLDVLTEVGHAKEIVVVDDGSTDDTSAIASRYPIHSVRLEKNAGKGAAMQKGLDSAPPDTDIFLFIDADLIGLKDHHIRDLVNPIMLDPDLDMTYGKFTDGRLATDLAQKMVPAITGQRAISRKYKELLPDLTPSGFAVEIVLTNTAKKLGLKTLEVEMQNVTHVMKEEKFGIFGGFIYRLKMYYEIFTHR